MSFANAYGSRRPEQMSRPAGMASLQDARISTIDLSNSLKIGERATAVRVRKPNGTYYRPDGKDMGNWEAPQRVAVDKWKKIQAPKTAGFDTNVSAFKAEDLLTAPDMHVERAQALRGRNLRGGYYRSDKEDADRWGRFEDQSKHAPRWQKQLTAARVAGILTKSTHFSQDNMMPAPLEAEERSTAFRIRKNDGTFHRPDKKDATSWNPFHGKEMAAVVHNTDSDTLGDFAGLAQNKSEKLEEVWKNQGKFAKYDKAERTIALRTRKDNGTLYRNDTKDVDAWNKPDVNMTHDAKLKMIALSKKIKYAGVITDLTPIEDVLSSFPPPPDERTVALRQRKANGTFYRPDKKDLSCWVPVHSSETHEARQKFKLPSPSGESTVPTPIHETIAAMNAYVVEPRQQSHRHRKPNGSFYRGDDRDMEHWSTGQRHAHRLRGPDITSLKNTRDMSNMASIGKMLQSLSAR